MAAVLAVLPVGIVVNADAPAGDEVTGQPALTPLEAVIDLAHGVMREVAVAVHAKGDEGELPVIIEGTDGLAQGLGGVHCLHTRLDVVLHRGGLLDSDIDRGKVGAVQIDLQAVAQVADVVIVVALSASPIRWGSPPGRCCPGPAHSRWENLVDLVPGLLLAGNFHFWPSLTFSFGLRNKKLACWPLSGVCKLILVGAKQKNFDFPLAFS